MMEKLEKVGNKINKDGKKLRFNYKDMKKIEVLIKFGQSISVIRHANIEKSSFDFVKSYFPSCQKLFCFV